MAENKNIKLPENLDVLIHLPMSDRRENLCVAEALQYSISAVGSSPAEALEELVGLVKQYCLKILKEGNNPICLADKYYWDAFGLGTSIRDTHFVDVHARLSRELLKSLIKSEVKVRSICSLQKESGIFNVEKLKEFVEAIS